MSKQEPMTHDDFLRHKWAGKVGIHLVGKKITSVRYLTPQEADQLGFYRSPILIELEGGIQLTPMSDDEGNDAGSIATNITGLETIPVI